MKPHGIVVAVFAQLALGCATIPASHYQSAKPLPAGANFVALGADVGVHGGQGIDGTGLVADKGEVSQHVSPNLELEWNHGFGRGTQAGLNVSLTNIRASARFTFLDSPVLKMALGGEAGAFGGSYEKLHAGVKTVGNVNGEWYGIPLTISLHTSDRLAFVAGGSATWIRTRGAFKDKPQGQIGGGGPTYHPEARYVMPGGFVGLVAGRIVQFSIGVSGYSVPATYPYPETGNGVLFVPYLGLAFCGEGRRHGAPAHAGPPPEPPPESRPAP